MRDPKTWCRAHFAPQKREALRSQFCKAVHEFKRVSPRKEGRKPLLGQCPTHCTTEPHIMTKLAFTSFPHFRQRKIIPSPLCVTLLLYFVCTSTMVRVFGLRLRSFLQLTHFSSSIGTKYRRAEWKYISRIWERKEELEECVSPLYTVCGVKFQKQMMHISAVGQFSLALRQICSVCEVGMCVSSLKMSPQQAF